MLQTADRIRALAIELTQDGSLESLTAAACLLALSGALYEGGESLGAFSDFCENYARNMIERLEHDRETRTRGEAVKSITLS